MSLTKHPRTVYSEWYDFIVNPKTYSKLKTHICIHNDIHVIKCWLAVKSFSHHVGGQAAFC